MSTKLCKDCRWVRWASGLRGHAAMNADCGHPTSVRPTTVSPITGEVKLAAPMTCGTVRLGWNPEFCGPDGKHWEAAA
jgi:hypothetical protein